MRALFVLPALMFAAVPSPEAPTGARVYDGALTTRILEFDRCGAPVETSVSIGAKLLLGPPVSSAPAEPGFPEAAGTDENPISIVLDEPAVADALRPGAIRLMSAARFGATSPPLVLQYWRLAAGDDDVAGVLAADHVEEAAAANLLADEHLFDPCRPSLGSYPDHYPIAEGAELAGKLGPESADVTIRGGTYDRSRAFASRFTGTAG